MALTLYTAPSCLPVTIDEAARYARVSTDAEKGRLMVMLGPAVTAVEQVTGRALINRVYDLTLATFPPSGRLVISPAPLVSVASVTYYDESNVLRTLASSVYRVVAPSGDLAECGTLSLEPDQSWPATYDRDDAVIVRFTAGYGTTSSPVPETLRLAVMMRAQQLYDGTWDGVTFEATVSTYRLQWGIA